MLTMTGVLIDVRQSVPDATGKITFNLVFEGTKYDSGLKREVPASVQIMVSDEHKIQVPDLKKCIGSPTAVQVQARVSKKNTVWYLTDGLGLIVD
jgi:hypothetical protein